jgi:hypothetical protein
LTISGGPKNDLQVTVEIPRKTGLFVRMPAGDLDLRNVLGDKDAELHAGELVIRIGDARQYGHRDASVTAGDLDASAFGVSKGGLWRSFKQQGPGPYRLHAHVGAGELSIRGSN